MSGSSATPRSRQTNPRRAGATANVKPGRRRAGREQRRLDPAEQVALPFRLAAMGERDDDVEALPEQAGKLVLGLGQPARDERRPLRVEENGWPWGSVSSSVAPSSDSSATPSSRQTARTSSGCQTRSGTRSSGSTRSSGTAPGASSSSSTSVGSTRSAAALGRRVDRHLVDVSERALRERRERADPLDLVAEELDPDGLAAGRREDVDEPAANGELSALLDPLDPLVPGERERLGEQLEPRLLAAGDADRRRPRLGRRQRLGQRERRRADEPAPREHVEGARPLADEMRRRLEARAPVHAARREAAPPRPRR